MTETDPRRLPPLTALRALEALHLTGSVTAAAQRLRVSHSAVSHQIRILESWSGTPLFTRRGRVTLLTEAGRSLASVAHGSFDAIRHEIDRLPLRGVRPVSVAALPIVASTLILPALPRFLRDRPGVRLHLTLALTDRPTTPAPDVEIVFVRRVAMLASDTVLLPGDAVPACAPALLDGRTPEDMLARGPLIHDEDMRMWSAWQAATGLTRDPAAGAAQAILEGSGLIHGAVMSGIGIGFVRRALIAEDVAAGRMVVCSQRAIDADWAYVLRRAAGRADAAELGAVVDWIVGLCRAASDRVPSGGT